jgi:hypothetical protein
VSERNANLSLISIAKIDPNPIHYQLYKLYFESVIAETVVSVKSMTKWKTAKNPENWKPVTEFVKDRTRKKLKKLKKKICGLKTCGRPSSRRLKIL